jgi:hypothetical protein
MSKRLMVSMVALIAGLTFSSILRAQSAAGDGTKKDKWNSIPPSRASYVGKKPSGPAPRRDISGTWDAAGMQEALGTSGALEHPALFPGRKGAEGGRDDETGIEHPLPYTPLGLAALKANKPSGPGVRQVHAALANDPADKCDPLGFPYMELWEFRTVKLVQTANQVILISPFYGNYRIIWTDGRELPTDPDPRWNGYSVGKWADDYTFLVETVGLNPKSWLDHAGRPHSDQLRVTEEFHRVDHDTMELTMTIDDPKMYTEPWKALNKLTIHLQPADFDIPELLCSPTEMAQYNEQIGSGAAGEKK